MEAAYQIGAAGPRQSIREVLKMSAGGEAFDDYKEDDTLYLWKKKRTSRDRSLTKAVAGEIERRLSDPKTPDDYRRALLSALRAYSDAAGSEYVPTAPAWSYIEARG